MLVFLTHRNGSNRFGFDFCHVKKLGGLLAKKPFVPDHFAACRILVWISLSQLEIGVCPRC